MKIRIRALDTLFFRDGKPFNMGDESWATGIFPPPPSVLYGVLRSAYLSQKGFSEVNIKKSESLVIRQVFLEKEDEENADREILFWAPADYVVKNKGQITEEERYLLQLSEKVGLSSYDSMLTHQLWPPKEDNGQNMIVESIGEGDHLLSNSAFKFYIHKQDALEYISLNKVLSLEPKIGIGRNNKTRVAAESELYRVGMQRLQGTEVDGKAGDKLNLIIDFQGLELDPKGLIKIGGEGKTAAYETYNESNLEYDSPALENGVFKLYLATPALFGNGWLPSWIGEDRTGIYQGLKLQLLAAVVGKPLSIGGFDIKKRKPKSMLKAVPAGSVYYFKLIEGDSKNLTKVFHQQCISDFKSNEGFGLAFLGKTKIVKT